jgi:hypothetical protein
VLQGLAAGEREEQDLPVAAPCTTGYLILHRPGRPRAGATESAKIARIRVVLVLSVFTRLG